MTLSEIRREQLKLVHNEKPKKPFEDKMAEDVKKYREMGMDPLEQLSNVLMGFGLEALDGGKNKR